MLCLKTWVALLRWSGPLDTSCLTENWSLGGGMKLGFCVQGIVRAPDLFSFLLCRFQAASNRRHCMCMTPFLLQPSYAAGNMPLLADLEKQRLVNCISQRWGYRTEARLGSGSQGGKPRHLLLSSPLPAA